jgi:aspartate racemase
MVVRSATGRASAEEGGRVDHIGILGHSAEGSALCYRTACHAGGVRLGEHQHPEITLSIVGMAAAMPAWEALDFAAVRAILAGTAGRLAGAGCDFFVCPDNTAHLALEEPGPDLPLPGLHIAHVVAAEAASRGLRRIGVLGTGWTMDSALYPTALARHGLAAMVPEAEERALINRVIFDELCHGVFTDRARKEFQEIIERLAARGCDGVVLGCTEIPLLVSQDDSVLPVLDSTRLLAHAAVDVAVGDRARPTWRGGPYRE